VRRAIAALIIGPDLLQRWSRTEVELDLPCCRPDRGNTRQLAAVAIVVVVLGVVASVIFVALLVGPLRRLRHGVEQLAAGDLAVRVPPTSGDEVGELTRAFNEMGDSLSSQRGTPRPRVNDYVLNQLLGPGGGGARGRREVTILFADIRGFTHLSEGLKAHKVVALLNEIFQLVSDKILERGGTIDKFIGDAVMAFFGAPVTQPDHALRALSAAIAIQRPLWRACGPASSPALTSRPPSRSESDPHGGGRGRQHRLGSAHRLHRCRRRGQCRPPTGEARAAGGDPGVGGGAARGAGRGAAAFRGRQLSDREPARLPVEIDDRELRRSRARPPGMRATSVRRFAP
jgi:HAMP domain-containing protein